MTRSSWRASLALLLAATPLLAQERTGPVVLRVPASAWALATGDALTAGRSTPDLLFYNPSGLTLAGGVSVSLQRWGSASTAASLSHAVISNGWGIGLGARYLDYGASGDGLTHPAELMSRGGDLASSLAVSLGLSREVKGFRVGVAAKYVEERLPGDRDGFGALDVGVGRDLGMLGLGLAVRNLGPDRLLADAPLETPLRASVGALLRPRPIGVFFDLAATAEVAVARDGRVDAAAGGELIWVPLDGWAIAARLGVRTVEAIGSLGARPYTAGLGVSLDRFSVDYAVDPARGGGTSHRIGIRMR